MTVASDFYSERSITPPSLTSLMTAVMRNRLSTALPSWNGSARLPGRPKGPLRYLFRGQADAAWSLSSTLYRAAKQTTDRVGEYELGRVELAVLRQMRSEGLGQRMKDGELLMVLQHHAIPTRLIDFSRSAAPALYFATENQDGVDGRLFIIGQRVDDGVYPKLALEQEATLPWANAAIGTAYSRRSWTETVAEVGDAALDPRMRAQNGCFLVGGVIKRYAGENLFVNGRILSAEELPDITTLRISFSQRAARRAASKRWPAVGWTVRIPAEWKAEIRSSLVSRGYSHDTMYPDFDGCKRLGNYIAAHTL